MKKAFLAILCIVLGTAAWAQNGYRINPGDVLAIDVRDSYLRSEARLVAAVGIEGLIVVEEQRFLAAAD